MKLAQSKIIATQTTRHRVKLIDADGNEAKTATKVELTQMLYLHPWPDKVSLAIDNTSPSLPGKDALATYTIKSRDELVDIIAALQAAVDDEAFWTSSSN